MLLRRSDTPSVPSRRVPRDSFASKLRLIRKRWEENYAEGRRLRIAYRVAGEAVGAAAVTLAVGYLKNVPGRGTSAGRALFLGGAWAVYYNVLQELIKSQRGIDEWVNSASAGALMGFAVGVPYAGWRKAPVMAFQVRSCSRAAPDRPRARCDSLRDAQHRRSCAQMGVLATLGRLGGDFLGLGRAFEQSLVQSGLLDEPPSKPPSDARGREWWLLIPGTKALPGGRARGLAA